MKTIAKKAPTVNRKPDMNENSSASEVMLRKVKMRDKEQKKVPLRIDHKTVIMVKPTNCNPVYAEKIKKKFEIGFIPISRR